MRRKTFLLLLAMATPFSLFTSGVVSGAPLRGGTLAPALIPKYVTPLVIPPEMPQSTKQPGLPVADYNIAVRRLKQQILPGGIWGSAYDFPATTVWSYGRAQDPLPNSSSMPGGASGVAPALPSSFNYPALTVEAKSGNLSKVTLNEVMPGQVCLPPKVDGTQETVSLDDTICELQGGEPIGPGQALVGVFESDAGNRVPLPLPWMHPVTESPIMNSTETWEIYNTTEDAHPIHLNLVAFQVVDRQLFDPATFEPVGTATGPDPAEQGYNDTVVAHPGEITRIRAKFEMAGTYAWHCHIVEHEDNGMRRTPYTVRFDPGCPDLNGDGKINILDVKIMLSKIAEQKSSPRFKNLVYDLNGDGAVNGADLQHLQQRLTANLKGLQ